MNKSGAASVGVVALIGVLVSLMGVTMRQASSAQELAQGARTTAEANTVRIEGVAMNVARIETQLTALIGMLSEKCTSFDNKLDALKTEIGAVQVAIAGLHRPD